METDLTAAEGLNLDVDPPEAVKTPIKKNLKGIQMSHLIPEFRRSLFLKTANGTASPRQAIKAKCLSCVCYEDSSTRIRDRSSYLCPLWAFRPFQDRP